MAKKSLIEREKRRYFLVQKYSEKRKFLKSELKKAKLTEDKLKIQLKLQKLPRNSSPTRLHNRCSLTGRPRAFNRFFGLSRNALRELALKGLLPGVVKSSW